jgi:hypothetical protein
MRFFGLLSFRQIAPFGGGWRKELDDPSHGVWSTYDISGNSGEKNEIMVWPSSKKERTTLGQPKV